MTRASMQAVPAVDLAHQVSRCRACKRGLSAPLSVQAGAGPVCRMSSKAQEATLNNNLFAPADYTARVVDGVLVVEDLNQGGRSVTNDINNVLLSLAEFLTQSADSLVVYRDSAGIWDGVAITAAGEFGGFYSLNATDAGNAITRAVRRKKRLLTIAAKKPDGGEPCKTITGTNSAVSGLPFRQWGRTLLNRFMKKPAR